MPDDAGTHPPMPGRIVQPNLLSIEEAFADVTFPISKKDMMEQIEDGSVLFNGRNVDMRLLVRDLNDDFFESEEEFRQAVEQQLGMTDDNEEFAGVLATGPEKDWQSDQGPGRTNGPRSYMEP